MSRMCSVQNVGGYVQDVGGLLGLASKTTHMIPSGLSSPLSHIWMIPP